MREQVQTIEKGLLSVVDIINRTPYLRDNTRLFSQIFASENVNFLRRIGIKDRNIQSALSWDKPARTVRSYRSISHIRTYYRTHTIRNGSFFSRVR